MATALTLIRFSKKFGKPSKEYGLQETQGGLLANLFDHEADQIEMHGNHEWAFVRELGECNDNDDFWNLVAECKQIHPRES